MRCIQPEPDLFKRNDIDIATLELSDGKKRKHQFTYGLDAVCKELSVNVMKTVSTKSINECDIALLSLCSVQDTLEFVCQVEERPKSRLIVGGHGIYPFLAWKHLTHRIMFGRAEQAVDEIILRDNPLDYCYDYDRDCNVDKKYTIRQARELLEGESSVGCNGSCKFCQYRATRSSFGKYYGNSTRGAQVVEDRWEMLQCKTGQNTTALDGWSQETRKRVGKPVDDQQIIDKLNWVFERLSGIMRLKVFQIVGYPWETAESLKEDVLKMRDVLSKVRPGIGGRIMMMFTVTPFSPEPLTPMENDPANIETNWREILLHDDLRCVFDSPHLNAFTLPQIPGPLTLYKRVAVNRGVSVDKLRKIAVAKTIDEAVSIGGDIFKKNAGNRVSGVLAKEKHT